MNAGILLHVVGLGTQRWEPGLATVPCRSLPLVQRPGREYARCVDMPSEGHNRAPGQVSPPLLDFRDFYEEVRTRHLPRLRREFGTLGEDAFQDMIVAAFERWPDVATMEHPVAWASVVAHRAAVRRAVRDQRRAMLEARAVGQSETDHVPEGRAGRELVEALAALRPDHAEAFWLTQVADLEIAKVAARLGVPVNTVKVWVHRARQRLALATAGLSGRWQCEQIADPCGIEQSLVVRGHKAHVDAVMCCLFDRQVRWELHIDNGRYWLGTDDGERLDTGRVGIGRPGSLALTSIALSETVDGVSRPVPPGSEGTSIHGFAVDGDRLRLTQISNDIAPTNGVPDRVFREIFNHEIVYRWTGPTHFAGPFDIAR